MADDFTRHIIQVMIARVAENYGFESISEAALEILTDSVIDTLSDYARSASAIAASSGRTQTNAQDIFAALARYDVTADSLANFLRSRPKIPQFEFLVEPYPLPRGIRLLASQMTGNAPVQAVPFRGNTTFVPHDGDTFVPGFFPHYPQPYTHDFTVPTSDTTPDDAEAVRKRETDQQQIKTALHQLLAGGTSDQPQELNLDGQLVSLEGQYLISAPTDLLEAPTYSLDGDRTRVDPEFLPMIPVTDELAGEPVPSRPAVEMLMILSIKQGTDKLGTQKQATYNMGGTEKELERAPSPASS